MVTGGAVTVRESVEDAGGVLKSARNLFAQGFAETWAKTFGDNTSLVHVDLSHNHLNKTDVEIIADGLKSNHTILGIHFQGNDGDIDD